MAVRTARQAAPARQWVAVTPSNSVNLPAGCCGLFVTGVGNVAAVGADGHVEVFPVAEANKFLPLGPIRVNSTNTTATGIIALY
jgi:phage terminase large subunit-like protein